MILFIPLELAASMRRQEKKNKKKREILSCPPEFAGN